MEADCNQSVEMDLHVSPAYRYFSDSINIILSKGYYMMSKALLLYQSGFSTLTQFIE